MVDRADSGGREGDVESPNRVKAAAMRAAVRVVRAVRSHSSSDKPPNKGGNAEAERRGGGERRRQLQLQAHELEM